jgi:hypothetical protein
VEGIESFCERVSDGKIFIESGMINVSISCGKEFRIETKNIIRKKRI